MAGGGDLGMDVGIVLFIMIQIGESMGEFHFGTGGYPIIGERIIETISGEAPWNYHYIPHSDLQRNWRTWHNTHYWDKPEHREFTHHHDGRPYAVRARDKGNLDKGYREGHLDKGHDRNQPNKGTTQGNLNKSSTGAGQRNLNKTATTGQGKVGTGGHGATDSKVHSSGHKTQGQHAKGTEGKK